MTENKTSVTAIFFGFRGVFAGYNREKGERICLGLGQKGATGQGAEIRGTGRKGPGSWVCLGFLCREKDEGEKRPQVGGTGYLVFFRGTRRVGPRQHTPCPPRSWNKDKKMNWNLGMNK